MFDVLAKRIFGSANDRIIDKYWQVVKRINAHEENIKKFSDSELRAQTDKFKEMLAGGLELNDILVEAFATVRESSWRLLRMRHFDVQLIGGMILHDGMIAEMKTGEGKTLVETLPAYLNALSGKGVHIVSVNDYLVTRDAAWMGQIFDFLGLSVGCITAKISDQARQNAYSADITYGTNNEFGFDYLRDNMKFSVEEMVQRPFNFAIIDEVDSILIDESRTPLIISGVAEDNSATYKKVNQVITNLQESRDFEKDEKSQSIMLTEAGIEYTENLLKEANLLDKDSSLYDINSLSFVHHVNQALKAHHMFVNDIDYIVNNDKVVIIDEFTGRMMEGRRFSEGLHQALEAKENVTIHSENQTLASITFQNYFRMYPKLSGMTGTAITESKEFSDIYGIDTVAVPTNIPIMRVDHNDEIYPTIKSKNQSIIESIKASYKRQQPVLVGTISIEKSEEISKLLKKDKIPHNILNAKHHEKEAQIIAQAGQPGAVTIATNMAGRGTDIMLGGNPDLLIAEKTAKIEDAAKLEQAVKKIKEEYYETKQKVIDAGGLYVLATERHESRRIDNQLRGRSGRQGDVGKTKFFISLEDDLIRIFGTDKMSGLLEKIGFREGESINHPWISKAIEKAQTKVEERNYEIRKNLLRFDNVMNEQRRVIFGHRLTIIKRDNVSDDIKDYVDQINNNIIAEAIPKKSYKEQWDVEFIDNNIRRIYGLTLPIQEWVDQEGSVEEDILNQLKQEIQALFTQKETEYGVDIMRMAEKRILLLTLDEAWKDHLFALDQLKQGIYLRAYGQKDPLNEYKIESFHMFENMMWQFKESSISHIAKMTMSIGNIKSNDVGAIRSHNEYVTQTNHESPADLLEKSSGGGSGGVSGANSPVINHFVKPEDRDPNDMSTWGKVGRNELCPCGSGKKYKYCHGKVA
ncbi:MAG: preprotein translocase subunit SecA [Pseudomonadota bacterium]